MSEIVDNIIEESFDDEVVIDIHPEEDDEIFKLKWPDNIKKRASAYGFDYRTPSLLVRECIDNVVDLYLKKRVSIKLRVYTNLNDYHMIYDNGSGMPIYADKDYDGNQPITVDMLTSINVGSNFQDREYSIGINGIGTKLFTGLAEDFYVIVNAKKKPKETLVDKLKDKVDDNPYFVIHFKEGYLQGWDLYNKEQILGFDLPKSVIAKLDDYINLDLGTIILGKPDKQFIIENKVSYHGYPFKLIKGLFRNDTYYKDLILDFKMNGEDFEAFDMKKSFDCEFINNKTFQTSIDIPTKEKDPIKFLIEFGYDKSSFSVDSKGSINLSKSDSGRHIDIIREGIYKALSMHNDLIKNKDARYGLKVFGLTLCIDPIYTSQTKEKLSRYGDRGAPSREAMEKTIAVHIYKNIIMKNEEYFDAVCSRIIEYKKQMEMLNKKDFIKSHIEYGNDDPTKKPNSVEMARVHDCTSKIVDERELFIFEGKSAGNGILETRNIKTTAVLALRGVSLNVTNKKIEKMLTNPEFKALYTVVGAGIDPYFKLDKMRYGKIIISTDADSAGQYISALILGFIGKYMRSAIQAGRVFLLDTPLYRQEGKYIFSKEDLNKRKPFVRFKG